MPELQLTKLLDLSNLEVVRYEMPDAETAILEIESTLAVAICPSCKTPSTAIHDDDPRFVRDLSLSGRKSYLRYCSRRLECAVCQQSFTERVAWLNFDSSYTNRAQARDALRRWMKQVEKQSVTALQSFLVTLKNWSELILNYFLECWTNVFAEGINNKIKLIKRRAFGFTDFDHLRLRILVECAPTPLNPKEPLFFTTAKPVEAFGWSLVYAWIMLIRIRPPSLLLGILAGIGITYVQRARTH